MKVSDIAPSKYLKADVDVPEEGVITLTITDVSMEEMGQGADKKSNAVVYFKEVEKGLVLNKTNMNMIATFYGDETDDWEGKQINLVSTDVEYQGKRMRGIRVGAKKPKPQAKPKPVPVVMADTAEDYDGEDPAF